MIISLSYYFISIMLQMQFKIHSLVYFQGDYNIILPDWHQGAKGNYMQVACNTELVGRQVALLIRQMIKAGAKPKDIHLIGTSLGAHISGYAGQALKIKGIKIGKITGNK